ncbi:flavodoxin FldB [Nitrincola iocasae]|jgi:flavodoxin long chain|uniref:Flavodoxin n=1 Tax=Nitrincola iocasae TaxID=2614693 RepID=A0A5J6LJB1_9GAMM|nr:flavodoxin FldB [Nitrincola iocasae]QEW08634.1 flavodoxin FldB [Nitrincola iocasae]
MQTIEEPIGVFYASTTGNTELVAEKIAELLAGRARLHDIAVEGLVAIPAYKYMIMGIPTWDFGELQEDWAVHWDALGQMDLSGVQIALFGLGDQIGYGEWFQDAMGALHDLLRNTGAQMLGYWSVEGYDFEASKALTEDGQQFVGLALDEDGQSGLTDERLQKWLVDVCNVIQAS